MRASLVSSALVAALIGYGSTVALILAAAAAVGATAAQTASWLLAICLAKASGSLFLSWRFRVPVVLAWSTPGAALIAASMGISMAEAVGAFVLAGALTVLTGAFRPLGRAIAAIPDGVAAGMLAGVLLPFCLKLPASVSALPQIGLPMVAVFLLVRLKNPAQAVLAALVVGVALAFALGLAGLSDFSVGWPRLTFIAPDFRLGALMGLGLPMYLVTMASQNLPGFATLRAHGYAAPVRPALAVTGGLSMVAGLFGAHPVSMAAITAAIVMGPDTHPDAGERWRAAIPYAAIWVCLGLFGPLVIGVLGALPPALVAGLVGLALLAPFTGAAAGAFAVPEDRFAAAVTLVVTASGVAIAGVGAAFWGLLAGLAVWGLSRAVAR